MNLALIQARKKNTPAERKQQSMKKLITFTGSVITTVSIIVTAFELSTKPVTGSVSGQAHLLLTLLSYSKRACRLLAMSVNPMLPMIMPIGEYSIFVEPSKRATYPYIMQIRCAACLKYARKKALPACSATWQSLRLFTRNRRRTDADT